MQRCGNFGGVDGDDLEKMEENNEMSGLLCVSENYGSRENMWFGCCENDERKEIIQYGKSQPNVGWWERRKNKGKRGFKKKKRWCYTYVGCM